MLWGDGREGQIPDNVGALFDLAGRASAAPVVPSFPGGLGVPSRKARWVVVVWEFYTHNSRGRQSLPVSSQRDDPPCNHQRSPESQPGNSFPEESCLLGCPSSQGPTLSHSGPHHSCLPPSPVHTKYL